MLFEIFPLEGLRRVGILTALGLIPQHSARRTLLHHPDSGPAALLRVDTNVNHSSSNADARGHTNCPIEPAHNVRPRMKRARRHEARLQKRIARAQECGDDRKASFLIQRYVRSFDAKFCAAEQVNRNLKRKGQPGFSNHQLLIQAAAISAVTPPDDEVHIHAKPKKRWPDFRAIHSFKFADKARQHLVMAALRPTLHIDPRQHGTTNGGRTEIIRIVEAAVKSEEYKYVATCDIKDFYPTANRDWMRQALLTGERVTTSTILAEDDNQHRRRKRYTGWGLNKVCCSDYPLAVESQRGLPQGACSSPLIADFIVGEVLTGIELPEGILLENSADNFVIIGRTRADVGQAVHSLRDAFGRHPAGPFQLTDDGVRRVADGFEFLGYRFRRRKHSPLVVPTNANIQKFHRKVTEWIGRLHRGASAKRMLGSLRGWSNAFSASPFAEFLVRHDLYECLRSRAHAALWPAFELVLAPFDAAYQKRARQSDLYPKDAR